MAELSMLLLPQQLKNNIKLVRVPVSKAGNKKGVLCRTSCDSWSLENSKVSLSPRALKKAICAALLDKKDQNLLLTIERSPDEFYHYKICRSREDHTAFVLKTGVAKTFKTDYLNWSSTQVVPLESTVKTLLDVAIRSKREPIEHQILTEIRSQGQRKQSSKVIFWSSIVLVYALSYCLVFEKERWEQEPIVPVVQTETSATPKLEKLPAPEIEEGHKLKAINTSLGSTPESITSISKGLSERIAGGDLKPAKEPDANPKIELEDIDTEAVMAGWQEQLKAALSPKAAPDVKEMSAEEILNRLSKPGGGTGLNVQ